jgi:hypothetical protein
MVSGASMIESEKENVATGLPLKTICRSAAQKE